jgi:hypothetical protein
LINDSFSAEYESDNTSGDKIFDKKMINLSAFVETIDSIILALALA